MAQHRIKMTDLPEEVLEKILGYLSYDELAKKREVCRKFNVLCSRLLNHGFFNVERKHATISKKVRLLLPRRESERKVHPMYRHCNILAAIGARISMLSMTFMKYMDSNLCCFIPGKVIDEIMSILKIVDSTVQPPRGLTVLQELRDISVMAIEHFDEKIAPGLRPALLRPTIAFPGPCSIAKHVSRILVQDSLQKEMTKLKLRTTRYKQEILALNSNVFRMKQKMQRQRTVMLSQSHKIKNQARKIDEQNESIAQIKRQLEDFDMKYADILAGPPTPEHGCIKLLGTSKRPPAIKIVQKSVRFQLPPGDVEKRRTFIATDCETAPSKTPRLSLKEIDERHLVAASNAILNEFGSSAFPGMFLSSSLEAFLKSPINSLQSRKRKLNY